MFTFHHSTLSRMFASGNIIEASREATRDNWLAVRFDEKMTPEERKQMRVEKPFDVPAVHRSSAAEALEEVLAGSGATLPSRDSVDWRIAEDVRHGKGHVINKETDLPPENRWPDYHTLPLPADADGDGIPDFWEKQFGLNPSDAADSTKISAGGYANIEHYFNNTDPTGGHATIAYVSATISRADSGKGQPGELRVWRAGDDSSPLTVKYQVSGTAVLDKDYAPLSGTVTIPAHAKSAAIAVSPVKESAGITGKTVIVSLETGDSSYRVGCPSASMVVIR
jgi:hypothetical protein